MSAVQIVWAVADGNDDAGTFYGPFDTVAAATHFAGLLDERLHANYGEWYIYVETVLPPVLPEAMSS